MLEARAIIVQVEGQHALGQANPANGCEQCNGKDCGAGKLSQLFCSKPRQFQVDNPIYASAGDEVVISGCRECGIARDKPGLSVAIAAVGNGCDAWKYLGGAA